jgi:hypothetical protein
MELWEHVFHVEKRRFGFCHDKWHCKYQSCGLVTSADDLPVDFGPVIKVRLKHLSARAALIDFALPAKQETPRGMRKRSMKVAHHRGHLVDVKTLTASLTSRSFSLASLCQYLKTPTQELDTDEHGGPITDDYLDYDLTGFADIAQLIRQVQKADFVFDDLIGSIQHRGFLVLWLVCTTIKTITIISNKRCAAPIPVR